MHHVQFNVASIDFIPLGMDFAATHLPFIFSGQPFLSFHTAVSRSHSFLLLLHLSLVADAILSCLTTNNPNIIHADMSTA